MTMKNINWKLRFKNPMFVAQLLMSVLLPIVGYFGLTVQDLISWGVLIELLVKAVSNPFVLGTIVVSLYNAILDPTTKGIKDSEKVLGK